MTRRACGALLLACWAASVEATPKRYSLARVLSAPAGGEDAYFGWATAAAGSQLVVSALLEDAPNGAAYLIDPTSGAVLQSYSPPPGGALEFGHALAVVGGTLVVGAPAQRGGTPSTGAAYVFDLASGALLRTLTNPGPGTEFGYDLARFGSDVLVSARSGGAVHLFDGGTGALLRSFANPGYPYDAFGASIAVVGANVLVGAPNGVAFYTGLAYLFDGATGGLLRTFTNPTPDGDDGFGQVVGEIDGDVLVGDPYDSTDLPSAGQVHRFDAATGGLVRTFHGPGGALGTFGYGSVASVDGDLLAGSPGDRAVAEAGGAAYLLDGASGALRARFFPPAPMVNDLAGYSVGTVGTYVVVPAPYADTPEEDEGQVYLFEPCGSGIVEGSEECDDGNTLDGDGCSALCFVEPCTPTPPAGCLAPGAPGGASLLLKDGPKDALRWKWRGDTALPALGDPTTTAHHELCIWDSSGAPQPRLARSVAGGETCGERPCWQAQPGAGFIYKDKKPEPGGLSHLLLRAGASGSARIAVKGKGAALDVPVPPLTPPVTVQLHNVDTDTCWTAAFSTPAQNQPGRFSARSDGP